MKEWLVNHKRSVIIILIPLVILGGLWQVLSGKVSKALQAGLVATVGEKLNGQLEVGSIDLSILSWVRIRHVALYDNQHILIAKCPNIEIKYLLSNLLKGNLGMSSIEAVAVQGAEVWLKAEKDRWNWQGLMKEDNSGGSGTTDFRGKVELGEGTVHISNEQISQTIDGVNGSVDFAAYPADLAIDLKGRAGQAAVAIAGNWGEGDNAALTLRADGFDVARLGGLLPATPDVRLEKGILKNTQVTVKRGAQNELSYHAAGTFSALTVSGKADIREGEGKFSADQKGAQLEDVSLLISGQRITGKGSVLLAGDKQTLDFSLTLPDVDPAAFVSGLAAQRPVSAVIAITGSLTQPVVSGSFRIPQISMSGMSVSGVSGNLRYENERLKLQQVQGTAYQGSLSVAGDVLPADQSYELAASGSGMDSSALTDKDVQGPLDFTGHVSGKGEAAVTRGDFVIHNGKAYGLAFQTLTGSFVKRGETTDISNIVIKTALGTFYPEQLSRDALEKLSQHNIPTTQEEAKKAAADALLKRLFK